MSLMVKIICITVSMQILVLSLERTEAFFNSSNAVDHNLNDNLIGSIC